MKIERSFYSALFLFLSGSTAALSSTDSALRTEFDRAINKWIAPDSLGIYYLLSVPNRP